MDLVRLKNNNEALDRGFISGFILVVTGQALILHLHVHAQVPGSHPFIAVYIIVVHCQQLYEHVPAKWAK